MHISWGFGQILLSGGYLKLSENLGSTLFSCFIAFLWPNFLDPTPSLCAIMNEGKFLIRSFWIIWILFLSRSAELAAKERQVWPDSAVEALHHHPDPVVAGTRRNLGKDDGQQGWRFQPWSGKQLWQLLWTYCFKAITWFLTFPVCKWCTQMLEFLRVAVSI